MARKGLPWSGTARNCSQIADEVQQEIDAERQLDKLKKEADVLFAPLKQKLAKKEQEQQAKKKNSYTYSGRRCAFYDFRSCDKRSRFASVALI